MRVLRACALAVPVLLGAVAVHAEGDTGASFESAPGLYTAAELGLGGRPLYQKLFPNGWPTTRDFRRMTLEHGEATFADSIGAILGSGLGIPLEVSTFERERLEQAQQNGGGKAPGNMDTLLAQRWQAFAQVAGLAPVPDGWKPIFLPYRRGAPVPEKPFEETKLGTWSWPQKGQDQAVTLDAIGLSMYAFSLFGEQQLSAEHAAPGGNTTFAGRTDLDGFLGLVALECATAGMEEIKAKLCMSAFGANGKAELGPVPKSYDALITKGRGREYYLPHGFQATVSRATASYSIGTSNVDSKSRLFDQAAVLLGLSELAKASAPAKTGSGRFFSAEKRAASFPETTSADAAELAVFVAASMRTLHWNPAGKNTASFANYDAYGDTVRIEDAGLLLVALEQFLALQNPKVEKLAAEQKKMAIVLDNMTNFLVNVQKTSSPPMTGLCDSYNISNESAAELTAQGVEKRSLGAQGLVVRGLLAAHRASNAPGYTGKKHPEAKDAATAVLRWLEEKRWDKARRAYVEEVGKGGKTRALDAAAVLGALRDMALDTGDARYLLRYKAYLGTLRSCGLFLSETTRSRAALDGVKSPAETGKAPVVAAEVEIP